MYGNIIQIVAGIEHGLHIVSQSFLLDIADVGGLDYGKNSAVHADIQCKILKLRDVGLEPVVKLLQYNFIGPDRIRADDLNGGVIEKHNGT